MSVLDVQIFIMRGIEGEGWRRDIEGEVWRDTEREVRRDTEG